MGAHAPGRVRRPPGFLVGTSPHSRMRRRARYRPRSKISVVGQLGPWRALNRRVSGAGFTLCRQHAFSPVGLTVWPDRLARPFGLAVVTEPGKIPDDFAT